MTHKPLIIQALWDLGRAGAERVVFDIACGLQQRDYQVRVLSACGGGAMESLFRDQGIEVRLGPVTKNRRETMKFFRNEFSRERPDLLHTHLGSDVWAGFVARWQGIHPWIITSHNDDRNDPHLRHLLRGLAYRRADHVACVSEVVKNYTQREFRVDPTRLSVIRNGIDLSRIIKRPMHGYQDVPRLITVGRLTAQKGQAVLLKALAAVKRPWILEICGEGEERLHLERLAESLGIAPRVQFLGSVDNVPQRLAQSDIFCFSSQWEGQSLALMEAAGAGLPMVLSDLPVFKEIFSDQSALFAQPDSVEEWVKALRLILADPSRALRRAEAAQRLVTAQFSRDRMIDEYVALYTKLLRLNKKK